MARSQETGPPVIAAELRERLKEYLGFRHLFRNIYGIELKWDKLKDLLILLTTVGGLVISQAAGGGSGIQATVYDDAVRFAVQNEKVAVLRAEVFNLSGKRLFDSGPVMLSSRDNAV